MPSYRGVVHCPVCLDCCDADDPAWVALECGHILHQLCCLQWLERSPVCPSCRKTTRKQVKAYVENELDLGGGGGGADSDDLKRRWEEAQKENLRKVCIVPTATFKEC